MYKIRLYVVPEQEAVPKDLRDAEDHDKSTFGQPTTMQRKNSRRPGAVRLNVIQRDRKADAIAPMLKQIRQQRSNNVIVTNDPIPVRGLSARAIERQKENVDRDSTVQVLHAEMSVSDNNDCNARKSVFASPKIRQLAIDLQEKMLERNSKILPCGEQIENNVNCRNDDNNNNNSNNRNNNDDNDNDNGVYDKSRSAGRSDEIVERLRIRNSQYVESCRRRRVATIRNDDNAVLCTLSPIFENLNCTVNEIDVNESERSNAGNVDDCTKSLASGKNRRRYCERFLGRSSSLVCDLDDNGTIDECRRDEDRSGDSVVVLRRKNKLDGYKEYDLEQKIEVEIKMREGSARLLAAARHRAQSLEAARALLTSNERMSAYMAELQRRKKEPSNKTSLPASTARVSLSELRVPLMWRDSDHFKNRGDYRRFAVFCLARVGTEIHDTALLCPVDRSLTDISFPDVLVFNSVPAEFELTLEIYSHVLQEDLSIASTPRRIKRTIHSSISKTVGKKLAASLRDELNSGKIGPHFELMASARLTLDDTDDNIHTHDLVIGNLDNKHHALPLFGHFCCRLAAQPECISKEVCAGNISLDGRHCWARLVGFAVQTWDSRKLADEEQSPVDTVPVNRETLIQPSKSSSRELRIVNSVNGSEKITIVRLDSGEDAQRWLRQLVSHAKDHLRWKRAAESIQNVPCVESARNSFIGNKRQGSLYDETPLIESVQADYTTTRPTVQEIFGLTPSTSLSSCSSNNSPPSLRSRSLSTSGPRKLSANTLRSHWPFSNKSHD